MTLREKIDYLRTVITVEPILLIFTFVYHTSIYIEIDLQDYLDHQKPWMTISNEPIFYYASVAPMILLLGSYSDQHAIRKPFIILPLIGQLILTTTFYVCNIEEKRCTNNVFNLVKSISMSFGGIFLLLLMAFAYVADITDRSTRTFRFVFLQILALFSITVHSTFWLRQNGRNFEHYIFTNGALLLGAILYAMFWLPGPKSPELRSILDAFNPRHFLYTFKTLAVQRPVAKRNFMWVLFSVVVVTGIVGSLNYRIVYNLERLSSWLHPVVTYPVTTLIVAIIVLKLIRLSDLVILPIGLACIGVAYIIFALTENTVLLIIAQAIFTSNLVLVAAACLSIFTKNVPKEDYGKILALYYLCNILLGIFWFILISFAHIHMMRNAHFYLYLGTTLCAIFLPVVLWIRVLGNRVQATDQEAQTVVYNNEENCTSSV